MFTGWHYWQVPHALIQTRAWKLPGTTCARAECLQVLVSCHATAPACAMQLCKLGPLLRPNRLLQLRCCQHQANANKRLSVCVSAVLGQGPHACMLHACADLVLAWTKLRSRKQPSRLLCWPNCRRKAASSNRYTMMMLLCLLWVLASPMQQHFCKKALWRSSSSRVLASKQFTACSSVHYYVIYKAYLLPQKNLRSVRSCDNLGESHRRQEQHAQKQGQPGPRNHHL